MNTTDQPPILELPDVTRGQTYRFDQLHLDDILARTLPQVPDGKDMIIGYGVDLTGAAVGVVFHKEVGKTEWEARAAIGYTRGSGWSAAVGGTITR
jgi:hypothetical protein